MPRPRLRTPRYRLAFSTSGVWEIRWTENRRSRRISCGTGDRDAAEIFLAQFLAGVNAPPPENQQTVNMIFDAYGKEKNSRHLDGLIATMRPTFGPCQPQHITRILTGRYIAERRRSVKDSTINRELRQLRTCLNWAVKQQWMASAPHIEAPSPGRPKDRVLSRDEAAALLDACKSPHIRLFVLLGLHTGQRQGAILGLTWDRVDFTTGRIDFNEPDLPETKKRRAVVPINDTLLAALTDAQQLAQSNYVVEYNGGKVLRMKHGFAEACRLAGLKNVTPHVLRHTAASRMAMAGVPMFHVAEILAMTEQTLRRVYAKFDPTYGRSAVEALEA